VVHPERVARNHRQALLGFATLGPIARPAIPELVKLLSQPEVAERAYESLAQFDDNPVPWLLEVATNASTPLKVRISAMFALGNRDKADASILTVLLWGLKDSDANLRSVAASSLWRFPDQAEQIVPALSELLGDPSQSVRDSAAVALGALGQAAAAAVPVLLKVVETNGMYSAGAVALQRIAPETIDRAESLSRPYRLLSVGRWGNPRIQTNRLLPGLAPAPLMRPDPTTGNPTINPMTGLPIVNPQ
jgi:HEAT repeat protein